MSDIAIAVEGLGKRYVLSHQQGAAATRYNYNRFSDVLVRAVTAPFRRRADALVTKEDFWALRGVSFALRSGEVVGIVGRNGAGKSTLLKVLSRITEPSEGRIEIHGRVASLLEVGTGFHPELSGRENIFLNGAILGMGRAELRRKFDEIVQFAEVERFVDTPVKRYSSGMYLRLAFAVAAHLEPEILVVDEVLAVGDLAFQNKCLNKMQDVSNSGRTVLFVSHNMGAIQRLCPRTILLNRGTVLADGKTADVIQTYVAQGLAEQPELTLPAAPEQPIRLRRVRLLGPDGNLASEFRFDQGVTVEVDYDVNEAISECTVWASIRTVDEVQVLCTADTDTDKALLTRRAPGSYRTRVEFAPRWLNAGRFYLVVGIANSAYRISYDRVEFGTFTVLDIGTPEKDRPGVLQPFLPWSTAASGTAAFSAPERALDVVAAEGA